MKPKIPATIITGFLGSGKTTLIRHLLAHAGNKRLALIINEFGDIGVDGEVLKACGTHNCGPQDIIELANGCICCTVADDFIPTMSQLLARNPRPDHIIIETSGLALPQPLVRAFNWPDIATEVTIDGIITVVDGAALAEGRYADDEVAVQTMRQADPNLAHENPLEELFNDQMNCADVVVLNKVDLLTPAGIASVTQRLKQQVRDGVVITTATQGSLAPEVLFGLEKQAETDVANRKSTHEMEGETQHDHDDFISFHVDLALPQSRAELLERIAKVIANGAILRVKGFVAIGGATSRLLVQAVGPRLNSYFDRPWRPDETPASQLVVIGVKGLDRQAVTRALQG